MQLGKSPPRSARHTGLSDRKCSQSDFFAPIKAFSRKRSLSALGGRRVSGSQVPKRQSIAESTCAGLQCVEAIFGTELVSQLRQLGNTTVKPNAASFNFCLAPDRSVSCFSQVESHMGGRRRSQGGYRIVWMDCCCCGIEMN